MNKQQGFTLIELVMVIVILGILAVTALPKFADLSGEAEAAALQGVIGAAGSAMSVNYATCSALDHNAADARCTAVDNCTDVAGVLIDGALPTGYTLTNGTAMTTNGATLSCTITQTASANTGTFNAIAAGL